MEIRIVVISDSGQVDTREFKTFDEAGRFCYNKCIPSDAKSINPPESVSPTPDVEVGPSTTGTGFFKGYFPGRW